MARRIEQRREAQRARSDTGKGRAEGSSFLPFLFFLFSSHEESGGWRSGQGAEEKSKEGSKGKKAEKLPWRWKN
jgi:hypothetical protein